MTNKMISQKEVAPWKKCGWCLSLHPGGELTILTFAGKDASNEFDMIHRPDATAASCRRNLLSQLLAVRKRKSTENSFVLDTVGQRTQCDVCHGYESC